MTTAANGARTAPPGPIEPTRTTYFRSRDGLRIYGELFQPADPRAAVVIVHGYSEHGGRYREVANVLSRLGIASLTFDLRGHGRSEGQRGYVGRFTEYLDDLDAASTELEGQLGSAVPLGLIAHSNGALVTLRALADPWRRPKRAEFAVLSSPFLGLKLKVSSAKTMTARIASLALPSLSLPNELIVSNLTRDAAKQRERRLDTLCHDVASARWFTEAGNTQEWVREFAHRMETPSLWLVAGADKVADPASTRAVHSRLQSESEYHELAEHEHEVFNEVGRAQVFDLLGDYLTRKLSL